MDIKRLAGSQHMASVPLCSWPCLALELGLGTSTSLWSLWNAYPVRLHQNLCSCPSLLRVAIRCCWGLGIASWPRRPRWLLLQSTPAPSPLSLDPMSRLPKSCPTRRGCGRALPCVGWLHGAPAALLWDPVGSPGLSHPRPLAALWKAGRTTFFWPDSCPCSSVPQRPLMPIQSQDPGTAEWRGLQGLSTRCRNPQALPAEQLLSPHLSPPVMGGLPRQPIG
nr:uncharacterized protein LOC105714024 isoform X1 [Aotus nancymaae]